MRAVLLSAAMLLIAAAPAPRPGVLLTAADLDPARVLPPPPPMDSAQGKAERAELHEAEMRTPAEEADARLDGDTKNATIFGTVLGPRFDLAALPATAALLALVRASEKAAVDRGKDYFRRPRPYIVDPSLKACKHNGDPLSSYPSGHAAMAFSMGETLARLVPDKAGPILARAARYGQSRIVCEQHFRSDVTAGQQLGSLIAERLMAKPDFLVALQAARLELVSAGIAH